MPSLLDRENHFFVLARRGRRLTSWPAAVVLAFVLGLVLSAVLSLILNIVAEAILPDAFLEAATTALGAALQTVLGLLLGFVPLIALVWLWIRLYEGRPFWTLGFERQAAIGRYLRGMLVGLLMFGSALGLSALAGFLGFERGDPAFQGLPALAGVLVVFCGWAVQGLAEEILCRGWLLQSVGARYRPWLGILVSSLIFMLIHGLNPNLSPIALLNLLLFGVFAAFYAIREGGLWGVGALHTSWNWAQGNLFGLQVSGLGDGGAMLFNLHETGPDLVTGGLFGPEGGLAVTAVLVLGLAFFVMSERRRRPMLPEVRGATLEA